MFAWKKIIRKGSDHANSAPLPEKVTYSLETIMALQKSLERGFDDYIPRPKAAQDASRTEPKYQPVMAARFTQAKGFLQRLFLLGQEFPPIWKLIGNRKNRQKKLGARLNQQAK